MTDKDIIKGQANIDISNLRMAQEQGIITEFGKGKMEALEGIVDFINYLEAKEVDLKQKSFVKIDRKVLFEICDAILNHDGYSDVNDCLENDSECFWGKWDEGFRKKVENIRRNS